uniref:Uncharacterized protein n=1 Tax=Cyprinodon variegatus TaxID=28743 RepID=A0A3Q2EIF2_CYPVA
MKTIRAFLVLSIVVMIAEPGKSALISGIRNIIHGLRKVSGKVYK